MYYTAHEHTVFLIFINDLILTSEHFNFVLFADATNLISKDSEITTSEMEKIYDRCMSNRLIVNHSKTSQVLFRNHQKKVDEQFFHIDNLEILQSAKFLGIIIERHLSFVMHFNSIVQKLNFLLMMLRYLRKFLDKKCMIDIYYSFVYPHLIYGVEFWGHAPDYALEQILICQKKALEIEEIITTNITVAA